MKSLLVDALRQKHEGRDGDSLSDSGSFATQRADVGVATNDEANTSEESGDLELMATGAFVVATDEGAKKLDVAADDVADAADVEFSDTRAGEMMHGGLDEYVAPAADSLPPMPAVARYVPLACAALALLAAVVWFGIQHFELHHERSGIGASTAALRAASPVSEDGISATAPRFRYLDTDGQPLDDEAWQ